MLEKYLWPNVLGEKKHKSFVDHFTTPDRQWFCATNGHVLAVMKHTSGARDLRVVPIQLIVDAPRTEVVFLTDAILAALMQSKSKYVTFTVVGAEMAVTADDFVVVVDCSGTAERSATFQTHYIRQALGDVGPVAVLGIDIGSPTPTASLVTEWGTIYIAECRI